MSPSPLHKPRTRRRAGIYLRPSAPSALGKRSVPTAPDPHSSCAPRGTAPAPDVPAGSPAQYPGIMSNVGTSQSVPDAGHRRWPAPTRGTVPSA
ncbi:hypothetical protein CALCODRAFT_494757 [Calocera cornea HHB12733]|uniref:Uncharacterized protein n=1 Tax=Calocera cornea HHB12733 TaxID=1353952 RepID=A0A165GUM0_9BASI|nr:hypothetical protein CALCODRAFT_494757 [Calocera cornea HHB12733]